MQLRPSTSLRACSPRFWLLALTLCYVSLFNLVYETHISTKYEYWGMGLNENVATWYKIVSWILCLLPAMWLKTRITRPSELMVLLQYYILFIPAAFVLYNSQRPTLSPDDVLALVVTMFCGLTLIQIMCRLPLIAVRPRKLAAGVFWGSIGIFVALCTMYLLFVFRAHFQLTDLDAIYSVREEAGKLAAMPGGQLSGYALTWLSGVFLPILFSLAAFTGRWRSIALVAVGYVYLTGVFGTKTTLFAPIFLAMIFLWVREINDNMVAKLPIALIVLLAIPYVLDALGDVAELVQVWYVFVVLARTLSMPQLSIGQYYDFFERNPVTYLSHVRGINWLIDNPYGDADIPYMIGEYFYGSPLGANVGMWAQDGIAGFGIAGIVLISAICGIAFWLFDSIVAKHDIRFVVVASGFLGVSFTNVSLFTTVFTGGGGLMLLILYFMPAVELHVKGEGMLAHLSRQR